ncbi:class I SAM-dependent methyltransferase [Moorena sp. SIO2C4]|uniref:class I SAM-dependent methyltransferase n=1 Tax=Moorena sp. SIO2C4 TaxID=2607824 RepID=UPI0013C8307A|nr:class I SAM-dependent methyltransferase [Moorena sp. SIO2C4]NES43362.1 class I SAM-dependent methyltransferase [Moorena sp. SIO2C4]
MGKQESSDLVSVDNTYTELAKYYDNLMTSGYYDHKGYATSLQKILGERRKILDMGVGSGLLTEQMLLLENYNITGIDFSPAMLTQAEKRLKDNSVRLVCASIEDYETSETFEAVISTGGVFCFSYREQEQQYRLYSYCPNKDVQMKSLKKLYDILDKDGILCMSIQGDHTNSEMPIKDGIVYTQKTDFGEQSLQKTYTFSANGKILSQQQMRLIFFDEKEYLSLFETAGFSLVGQERTQKFCIFRKNELKKG